MRALITGSAGFLGSAIADALIEDGHEVTGIDNLTTGRRENVPEKMNFVEGDIADVQRMGLGDFDVIYHAAASYADRADWERDARTNVLGTIAVVREAQRTNARIIYFQTSLCYGTNPVSPVQSDAPLAPRGSYAVSKTAGESYVRDSGLEWVSLRLANIYGPRNLSGPVPTFFKRLSEGQSVTVVDSRRDFVYVDDLVRLAVHALARGQGIYHVSSGRDVSIAAMFHAVAEAMGGGYPEPAITPRAPDDVATLLLDPSDTLIEFGWAANTPLVTGIHEAVAYYRAFPPSQTFSHLATAKG